MIVMPADHVIEPAEAFRATVRAAVSVIDDDPTALVTFGIKPTHPETGYGYIERGPLLETRGGIPVHRVVQFREKPDRATAERFLAAGNFVWNSGIFVWRGADNSGRAQEPIDPDLATASSRSLRRWARRPRPRPWRGSFRGSSEYRSTRPSWSTPPNVRGARGALSLERRRRLASTGRLCSSTTRPATRSRARRRARHDQLDHHLRRWRPGGHLGVDDLVVVHSGKATLVARKDQLDKLKALVEGCLGRSHVHCRAIC